MRNALIFSNKRIATITFIGSGIMVFAMLHHPHGVSNDPFEIALMKWVHASMMLLLILNTLGPIRISHIVAANGQDMTLGLLFYYLGLGSFLIATTMSGFVQTSLIELYKLDSEEFSELSQFTTILNQVFAKLGVISFGASGICLFLTMISRPGLSRLLAITSAIVGSVLVITILAGVYLSVTTMTLLVILIIIWHWSIAAWLLKS